MASSRRTHGVSGCGVSKYYAQNPSPISALDVKSPHLQFLRVNQILRSNPTSSNTASLNSRIVRKGSDPRAAGTLKTNARRNPTHDPQHGATKALARCRLASPMRPATAAQLEAEGSRPECQPIRHQSDEPANQPDKQTHAARTFVTSQATPARAEVWTHARATLRPFDLVKRAAAGKGQRDRRRTRCPWNRIVYFHPCINVLCLQT